MNHHRHFSGKPAVLGCRVLGWVQDAVMFSGRDNQTQTKERV